MAYLMIDPCGEYPVAIMPFLGKKLNRGAVAVFSTRGRYMLWRDKWSKQLGEYVLDEYIAPQTPSVRALARLIGLEWPGLEGVVAWDEESVVLGAELGEHLGLGWNSADTIERCRDKGKMKAWIRDHGGVRVNAAQVVDGAGEAIDFAKRVGKWPIVVKPTGGSGSEDVYFSRDKDELLRHCQWVTESGSGQVLLEEYIGGREFAVNGVVDSKGDFLVTDIWIYDRRDAYGVHNLYFESIKVSSKHPVFWKLAQYVGKVVEIMGLKRCPVHAEVKVDEQGPCLIEIGARLSGGNLPTLASKIHGRSLFELAACHWIGNISATMSDLDYDKYDKYEARVLTGVQPQTLPRISAVQGIKEVEALPSFNGFGMVRPIGTTSPKTIDLDSRAWDVYLISDSRWQIARDAKAVRKVLRYE